MTEYEIYKKAMARARANGVDVMNYTDTIIFLEKEIDMYRGKIDYLEDRIKSLHKRLVTIQGDLNTALNRTVTLEAVQEGTAAEIIKALSDNGYNISINLFKDNESEES